MSGRLEPDWPSVWATVSVGGAVGTCVSASGGTGTKTSDVSELGAVSAESMVAMLVSGWSSAAAPLLTLAL